MAAACEDGVPADSAFARLLADAATAAELAGAGGGPELDRWQAQVLGRVLARAEVHLHSDGLDATAIEDALLVPAPDLDDAVTRALDGLAGAHGGRLARGAAHRGHGALSLRERLDL